MTSKLYRYSWLVALLLLLTACPAANAAATVSTLRVKGDAAVAIFQAFAPFDDCLESFVSAAAADFLEKVTSSGRTISVRTNLTVIEYNTCTQTVLFNGDGITDIHTFQVAANLSTATLTAEIEVLDVLSTLLYPFQMSLTWTAIGKPETSTSRSKFSDRDLGITITDTSQGRSVDAVATGTVIGRGWNHTPAPSDEASIRRESGGTYIVERTF